MAKLIKSCLITVLLIFLSSAAFCGTVYVGMENGGVMRLDDGDLAGWAYNKTGHTVYSLSLSKDLSRLYCIGKSKITVFDPVSLKKLETIEASGNEILLKIESDSLGVKVDKNVSKEVRPVATVKKPKFKFVVNTEENKVCKVDISSLSPNVVLEKAIPHPTAILVTPLDIGAKDIFYSGGNEIANINTMLSGEDERGTFPVVILAPFPGDIWSGEQDIYYWDEYINQGGYVYIDCDGNSLHTGALQNNGWFHWDTTTLGYNSENCYITILVQKGINYGIASSGPFTVYNATDTEPPIITDVVPLDGSGTTSRRPFFHATVADNAGLDIAKFWVDPPPSPHGTEPDMAHNLSGQTTGEVCYLRTADLSYGEHVYYLAVWDMAGNVSDVEINFTVTPSGCFLKGTPILMRDSITKPIEEMRVGDEILSLDEETKSFKTDTVKHLFTIPNEEKYLIINNHLKVTASHCFYLYTGEWLEAGELKIGDNLLNKDGKEETITSIEKVKETVTVYNLDIAANDTFIADNIVVHNAELLKTLKIKDNIAVPVLEKRKMKPDDSVTP